MRLFLLLFIIVPIIEMYLLIQVGGIIGALPTIALVFLTAMLGLYLLRQQGLNTLLKAQQKMQQGAVPAAEMLEGLLLAVGGVLLLTPGFFTDVLGFFCLLPMSRKKIVQKLVQSPRFSQQHFYASGYSQQGDIIEGEFTEESDKRLR